jgi:hypothetical protein
MAALIFRHIDQTTLETWLTNAATAVAQGGKTVISYTEAGRSVMKEFALPYRDFLEEVNAALELKDPDKYQPRITTTRVSFAAGRDGGGV